MVFSLFFLERQDRAQGLLQTAAATAPIIADIGWSRPIGCIPVRRAAGNKKPATKGGFFGQDKLWQIRR
ncbi:hypothetical protein CAter282_0586 [Collimonas arenae]|uniref:Uncharacterized protein n=1 Tax=Collimonas arenae TaxID=279058 RepID=A0A127QEG8_9BURK|nr:hypothetical protein [Collimonas arenae]AMP08396.1 hypothetical protein CAter282_0586 [Collimonas arenae]